MDTQLSDSVTLSCGEASRLRLHDNCFSGVLRALEITMDCSTISMSHHSMPLVDFPYGAADHKEDGHHLEEEISLAVNSPQMATSQHAFFSFT